MTDLNNLTPEKLRMVDGLFCVDEPRLSDMKSWEGQKFIQFTNESPNNYKPTSYIREDPIEWLARQPFNIENLTKNSTIVSFIASHWTYFRKELISNLQVYIPIASFGKVYKNTNWNIHPECSILEESTSQHEYFKAKNCIIVKYPFYLAIENLQEQDYSTEKLWDAFRLGIIPTI
ncbi:14187_t:CDS:2 [Cetraspora pellucida]|uniref:Fucosyltransferase n=1 Tax=Cetraspora pellucida TaxID=1433469 RepID=A0A9N9G5T6_9GLOM|nr:14187_t:CDS:2 [Cetraspora pellucida]